MALTFLLVFTFYHPTTKHWACCGQLQASAFDGLNLAFGAIVLGG
jgi:4-hydroxybenzoate polyprenyltransferase